MEMQDSYVRTRNQEQRGQSSGEAKIVRLSGEVFPTIRFTISFPDIWISNGISACPAFSHEPSAIAKVLASQAGI